MEESYLVKVCVFFAGWESALDSVDFTNRESSFLLDDRSFLVTDLWMPGWDTRFYWYLSCEDFIILLTLLYLGIEFFAGVTTVSVLAFWLITEMLVVFA